MTLGASAGGKYFYSTLLYVLHKRHLRSGQCLLKTAFHQSTLMG